MKSGIDADSKLYSMSFTLAGEALEGLGADMPKTERGIIALSGYAQKLISDGIKYVVVGEEYNKVIDLLRAKYPNVTIVPWHDAPAVLSEEATRISGDSFSPPPLDATSRPYYPSKENITPQRMEPIKAADDGADVW